MIAKPIANTKLTHYTLVFKPKLGPTISAGGNISLSQIPLGNPADAGNTPTPDYQGFFHNVSVTLSDGKIYQVLIQDSCQSTACNDPAPARLLGGYYTDWSVYAGHGKYDPSTIPVNNLNTIYYAVGKIHPDTGGVSLSDPWGDMGVAQHPLQTLTLFKQRYPYLNLIYSFGGWGSIANNNFPSGDLVTIP